MYFLWGPAVDIFDLTDFSIFSEHGISDILLTSLLKVEMANFKVISKHGRHRENVKKIIFKVLPFNFFDTNSFVTLHKDKVRLEMCGAHSDLIYAKFDHKYTLID